jgi:hypothetical protein
MEIRKATKYQIPLKIAITGPSGSGKTMSALKIATGIVGKGKILVIDTEYRSSELYADKYDFDVVTLDAPYTIKRYVEAMQLGIDNGYQCVIIDSASHAWAGKGGLIDKKDSLDARGGNSYTNWAGITKEHNSLIDAILAYPIHCICTLRSKTEYVLETNDKGRSVPKKVGMAPIQRDGFEYEFTVVFDLAMNHEYQVSKDRTSIYDGRMEKITEGTGVELVEWLKNAKAIVVSEPMGQMIEEAREHLEARVTHINDSLDKAAAQIPVDLDATEEANYRERNVKAYTMLITYAKESKNENLEAQVKSVGNNKNTSQKVKNEQFVTLYKQHLLNKGE